MAEKKVLKLAELIYEDGEKFTPSEREQKVVSEVIDLFRRAQSARDRNFQYFDGLNLIEYINDSVLRFNTNIDEREDIEDWQASVHDQFTRNKVLGILGKVMEVLPIAQFSGRNDEDTLKASILNDIYAYVEELDEYEEFMTHLLLEAIVKGTGIGYEDIEITQREYRDVKGVGDNLTISNTREKNTRLYAKIVPLEEFYPSSVSSRKIKEMPYCFWRQVMPYTKFVDVFGHYRKSQLVSGMGTHHEEDNQPYYYDYVDSTVPDGSVEVIRYYDKLKDEYIILANGIWINPLNMKDGEGTREEVSPLPWNHKDLPFWEVKFDFFGDFFYGKSLPDRLKSMQDVLNVLTNMLLDQSFLSIFPPLLTNGFDSIEDDYLRPGRRTPVDTQGLPINQAFHVLQTPTPSGWHQYILEYTRRVMEESSLDKVSQGVAGQGDRTTAQEIRVAASGVASMLQLFARMINYGIRRKAMLKASNILQFGFNTDAPILRKVLGEGSSEEAKNAFNIFKIDNTTLTGGGRGTKIIEVYKTKAQLPTRTNVRSRALLAEADSGKKVEIVAIPPTYIRDFQFDVKIVPNPKSNATQELEKALQLEKVRVYMSFFPEYVNKQELAAETAEKMGDDPTKVLLPEPMGWAPQSDQERDNGISLDPQENTANNLARGARGGEQGMAEMASLMQNITG